MDARIEFFRHSLGPEEKARVLAALDGVILTTGSFTAEAEQALGDYLGVPHVVCLDSCTAALHLALLAHDIGPGDEVIVPAMTFVATANAVLMTGAAPVFADVDPRNGCVTADTVAERITRKTRAILPVHLYGLLCDVEALHALAQRPGLALIEDAAHCIEARRGVVRPASHSHCACFSFYATKNITCGEGGALATHDARLAERVRRLSQHGLTSTAVERYGQTYKHWDMDELGWKYNLDNIRASLLTPQIRKLDQRWTRRRALAAEYEAALAGLPGVQIPEVLDPLWSARHLFPIWVERGRRDEVLAGLQARGVGVTVNYRAVHLLRYYRQKLGHQPGDLSAAEDIGERTLSLPFHPQMTSDQVQQVARAVEETIASGRLLTADS